MTTWCHRTVEVVVGHAVAIHAECELMHDHDSDPESKLCCAHVVGENSAGDKVVVELQWRGGAL